ncbi:MAG TPA: hypothetical protein VHZ07_00480 [Bryobacteraceae bacterium]|jgi:hypothetical protein|nr:hypothetical protein [Bryobacteraceae bacterium]
MQLAKTRFQIASPAVFAALTVLVLWTWMALDVQFNFRGQWSALFLSGAYSPPPPMLVSSTYLFPHSYGYDGQYYRYVAHDPLFRKGIARYVDGPTTRYDRILIPGLAAVLSAGQDRFTDAAYIAVVLAFIYVGALWLGRFAVANSGHPAWACVFGFLPATLISLQRMTVDVALTALCMGFVWYAGRNAFGPMFVIAVLAPLDRDTGLLLVVACCAHAVLARRWKWAVVYPTAIVPTLIWYRFVSVHSGIAHVASPLAPQEPPHWLFHHPFFGIVQGFWRIPHYPLGPLANRVAEATDIIAISAIILATILALWQARKSWKRPESIGALLFVLLVAAVSAPVYWKDINGYARTLAPLLLFVGLRYFRGATPLNWAPLLMVDARLSLEFGNQILSVLRGLGSLL